MGDEHQSGDLPDFAFRDRAHPDLLNLRGHFAALQEQGQIHSLYRILHVFPVTDTQAVLVSHHGAALVDVGGREILWSISCSSGVAALDVVHSQLALAGQRAVFVWDLRTGQLVLVLDTREDTATDMAFSPSGATLAVALYEDGVQLWRLADGVLLHTLRGEDEGYAASKSIALSPDGHLLAAGNFEAEDVWLWRVADGQLVRKMDEHPRAGRVLGLAFSPDGRVLVCGDGGGEKDVTLMRVWDVSTGRAVAGFPRKEWMPVFSSDGLLLASTRIARGTGPISIWGVAARTEVQ